MKTVPLKTLEIGAFFCFRKENIEERHFWFNAGPSSSNSNEHNVIRCFEHFWKGFEEASCEVIPLKITIEPLLD